MIERLSLLIGRVATLSLADLKREHGQTTVEYAVVVTLVIVMAGIAFGVLDGAVQGFIKDLSTYLTNAVAKIT